MSWLEIMQIIGFPLVIISLIIPFVLLKKNKLDIEVMDEERINPVKKEYGLQILLDSHELKEPIYSISGRLVNNGNKDISASDVISPVVLVLPENVVFYNEKLPVINPEIGFYNLQGNRLKFEIKLIKPDEHIKFNLLYTGKPNLKNEIKIIGRLKNIKSLRVLSMPLYKKRRLNLMLGFATITIIAYLLNVFEAFTIFNTKADFYLIIGPYLIFMTTLFVINNLREKRIEL